MLLFHSGGNFFPGSSPVSLGRNRALDDDDLPGVQASRYGPSVWDRLGVGGHNG